MSSLFIVNLTYTASLEQIDAVLIEHRSHLSRFYDSGEFICSGPQNPRVGGIIFAKTKTKERLVEIMSQDPFVIKNLISYQITEFNPVKMSEDFKASLS